jgi:hypothetical protein
VALTALDPYPFSLALFGQALWYEELDGFRDFSLFSLNEALFWQGRNLHLIGDSAGKAFLGTVVTKERALAEWGMTEGDGAWNVEIH